MDPPAPPVVLDEDAPPEPPVDAALELELDDESVMDEPPPREELLAEFAPSGGSEQVEAAKRKKSAPMIADELRMNVTLRFVWR